MFVWRRSGLKIELKLVDTLFLKNNISMGFNKFCSSSSPYKRDTLVSYECSVLQKKASDLCLLLLLVLLQ